MTAPVFSWFEDEFAPVPWRDYSGQRGPVPTGYPSWPAMSWQEAAELRPHVDRLRRRVLRDFLGVR